MADLFCLKYEDLVQDPERELRKVSGLLGVEDEGQMSEVDANREGIPEHSHRWMWRAVDGVDTSRIGAWREELSAEQRACLERWRREALGELGYEVATGGVQRLPRDFFPRLWCQFLTWKARNACRLAARDLLGR